MGAIRLDLTRDNPDGNFAIEQGASFNMVLTWNDTSSGNPYDLTGYTAKMKIRKNVGSPTTLASWTQASELVLGGTAGTITFNVTAAATSALDWQGLAVYDLTLTSSGGVATRLIEGNVELAKEVSA